MNLHLLIPRRSDGVRSRDDVVQHSVAIDRSIVLGINESVREQPLKDSDITSRQPDSPVIL